MASLMTRRIMMVSSKLPGKISPLDLECPPRNTPNTLDWLMVLMEPRTTAKSPKLKIRRFLAKLTPMEMEKSAWTSSSLKSLRSSKRFHEEISTGQRLLHLLFNSLIDSRFDFFLSFLCKYSLFLFFFFYILSFSVILSVYVLYVLFFFTWNK